MDANKTASEQFDPTDWEREVRMHCLHQAIECAKTNCTAYADDILKEAEKFRHWILAK